MNASLISTALLALQQSNQLEFTMTGGDSEDKSGFWWKTYVSDDDILLHSIIYLTESSPTGYAVQTCYSVCDEDDDETLAVLLEKSLESFKDFQKIFAPDYLEKVYVSHISEN